MEQQVELALKDSMHRVLVEMARFLPGLLAVIVAVAVFAAIGALSALILRRVLTAIQFDQRCARNPSANVVDWSTGHSPTQIVARIAFWACVVLGCILGLYAFGASYPSNPQIATLLIPDLTHAVGAVIILIVGTVLARFLARSVLIGAVNLQLQYARFLSLGVKWMVLVLTAAMVLDHLQIGGVVVELAFGILFGGIVLTLSLAVGLGSRELVSRSLEKSADLTLDPRPVAGRAHPGASNDASGPVAGTPAKPSATLRHF